MSSEWERADRSSGADGVTGGSPYSERAALTPFSTERSASASDAAAAVTGGAANASARPAADLDRADRSGRVVAAARSAERERDLGRETAGRCAGRAAEAAGERTGLHGEGGTTRRVAAAELRGPDRAVRTVPGTGDPGGRVGVGRRPRAAGGVDGRRRGDAARLGASDGAVRGVAAAGLHAAHRSVRTVSARSAHTGG